MGYLGLRMAHPHNSGIRCKDCSTILHSEKCQERQGNFFNGFSERNVTQSNLLILGQK